MGLKSIRTDSKDPILTRRSEGELRQNLSESPSSAGHGDESRLAAGFMAGVVRGSEGEERLPSRGAAGPRSCPLCPAAPLTAGAMGF